jgi:hypothetical protein
MAKLEELTRGARVKGARARGAPAHVLALLMSSLDVMRHMVRG